MFIEIQLNGKGGVKSTPIPIEDWTWARALAGQDANKLPQLYATVDWMFRCVALVSGAVMATPYTIAPIGGEPVYDSDKDDIYPPTVEAYESLDGELGKLAASYVLQGRAYMLRQKRRGIPVGLRYLDAQTIYPMINAAGLAGFERMMSNGVRERLPADDILYFWYPDPGVELGEPLAYPGKAAMRAAGVQSNLDEFLAAYFQRGMIKATLFMSKGVLVEAERQRLKTWWQRAATGIKNAFATEVIDGDSAEVIQIGDGIGELGNVGLTQEKREAISTAFGVPHSLVMSNAANYATAEQDVLNLYQNTIIPLCDQMQRALNAQIFRPLGLWFKFEYGRVESVQKSELAKAAMVQALVGKSVLTVNEGRELLGYDPVDGGDEIVQPVPQELAGQGGQLLPKPKAPGGNAPDIAQDMKALEYQRLRTFVRNGTYLKRAFTSDVLTPDEIEAEILSHEWQDYP